MTKYHLNEWGLRSCCYSHVVNGCYKFPLNLNMFPPYKWGMESALMVTGIDVPSSCACAMIWFSLNFIPTRWSMWQESLVIYLRIRKLRSQSALCVSVPNWSLITVILLPVISRLIHHCRLQQTRLLVNLVFVSYHPSSFCCWIFTLSHWAECYTE